MQRAVRRDRRRRFVTRAVIGGLVLFLALATVPRSVNPDVQPLLGLAEAVEAMPRPVVEAAVWYSRSEQIELIEVPDELLEDASAEGFEGRHLRFLLSSVREVWTGMGESAQRRRITYGAPQFLSPEDAGLFWSANLSSHYPTGRIVESSVPIGEIGFLGPADFVSPAAVSAGLRRQVAGVGQRRTEELKMLRLAASIIQTHGEDPVTRASVLRAIADIPGITVVESGQTVDVSFDYLDGDRPLRLSYAFDSETAHVVRESVVLLAAQAEASTVVSESWYEPVRPADGFSGS
jgi:hypothetical protein